MLSMLYRIVPVVNDTYVNNNVYSWLNCVKSIFKECGLSYIWYNQTYQLSREQLLTLVESSFKEYMSDSFTNYSYVGNTKVSVSTKKSYANKCTLSEIFLTEILKSFSVF